VVPVRAGMPRLWSVLLVAHTVSMWLRIAWSKSSPPRKVSPLVALTSRTSLEISRMLTSKVPPPRSYTAINPSFLSWPTYTLLA
jgi:hypothetical protein